jgi:hypothetical protein
MSEAVLSRFDLVFILLDKPDEQRDQMISDHVMAVRLFAAYDIGRYRDRRRLTLHIVISALYSCTRPKRRCTGRGRKVPMSITTVQLPRFLVAWLL